METFIVTVLMIAVISIFLITYLFFRMKKINKIERNCQVEFKKIIKTQASFSTKGSNCIVTFHKDSFQVKLNSLITDFDLDNIKYSDISLIEYGDPLSSKAIIKIKLISNFEITLGFINQKYFKELEHYRSYFLTKLFLKNNIQK
ncbi:MAG: hypothetical protein ACRC1R_00015 [Cetobacterium sp.]|uniref:hypothetical protein n=1 Tax=Cetobacterium sp. TaxID=2071632 RepID=UPI003F36F8E1